MTRPLILLLIWVATASCEPGSRDRSTLGKDAPGDADDLVADSGAVMTETISTEERACVAMDAGPGITLQAGASNTMAATLEPTQSRVDIALAKISGGNGGSIRYSAGAAEVLNIWLGAEVPLSIIKASTRAPVQIEQSAVDVCDAIDLQLSVSLSLGTHYIRLGPSHQTTLPIIIERASD